MAVDDLASDCRSAAPLVQPTEGGTWEKPNCEFLLRYPIAWNDAQFGQEPLPKGSNVVPFWVIYGNP